MKLIVVIAAASGALGLPRAAIGQTSRAAAVADSSPFRALDLPAPNAYRSGSGRPGPSYWQQRVSYGIRATLDPAKNELRGREMIDYTNNSPDALPYLWIYLEQNICAPGSITNLLNQPPLAFLGSSFDFSCQGFNGGVTVEDIRVDSTEVRGEVFGTTMRINLPYALPPHGSVTLMIGWHFNVPPQGAGRMGHDGPLYEIAQWYPRVAVYDDVRGWNHEPYIGAGEFYLEYGSFDVAITVPATYIVAATGRLTNARDVLTPTQSARLRAARFTDTTVAVIAKAEVGHPERTRPKTQGTLTWHFTADSVRDFAFAAGPDFRWDATSYDNILIETLYRPTATRWEEAIKMARAAIQYFSQQWYRYPYSHATTVEGPIEGMEYPMLTFVPNSPTREDQQWALSHEFGHDCFPMIFGSNERLYPWMDEGFNTFIDLAGAAKYFAGTPYGDSIEVHPLHLYADHGKPGNEQPLIEKPVEVRDLFWGGYQKPALMMQLLRYEVLGKDRFDAAFREYIRTWAFKHPTPADFFRLMRDESGMELDWFWRDWIFTTARLDQAVDSVSTTSAGGSVIHLENRGTMVMPAELAISFADGTKSTVKLPVEMWNLGARFDYRAQGAKRVQRVEVDPRHALPDIDRGNNTWPR
jgi:hypothetical protein